MLARFGSDHNVVMVNVDKKNSRVYKENIKYFKSRYIPFVVVVDAKGKVLHSFTGYRSYEQLKKEVGKFFK